MKHFGWVLALRLLGCAALFWAGWHFLGPIGLLMAAPVLGIAVAWPLLDLASRGARLARRTALQEDGEDLYEFRGHRLRVLEDVDDHRWLRTDEVRRVVAGLPRDAVLLHLFPDDVLASPRGQPPVRIRAERLDTALADAQADATVRFRRWLQREVIDPAARTRRRRGGA